VAELADAVDSKSIALWHVGSIPTFGIMKLEDTMKTLIATAFIATAAHANLTLTFEDLPEPTVPSSNVEFVVASPIGDYQGFQFLSNLVVPASNPEWQPFSGRWAYYDIKDVDFGGYDDGLVGDRALFTPYGSDAANGFRISRDELWRFVGADITAAWIDLDLTLTGYRDGSVVWSRTLSIPSMVRTRLEFDEVAIDTLKISGFSPNSPINHFILDNFSYEIVPTPSALALLAVAGVIRRRRR
jgi:hypothetical protein